MGGGSNALHTAFEPVLTLAQASPYRSIPFGVRPALL